MHGHPPPAPRPLRDAGADERRQRSDELHSAAVQLLALRTQIAELEVREDALKVQVRLLLQAGYRTEVDGQRPHLRPRFRREIDYAAFNETFGQKLTLACATIDPRAVDRVVATGLIDRAAASKITVEVALPPALHWQSPNRKAVTQQDGPHAKNYD